MYVVFQNDFTPLTSIPNNHATRKSKRQLYFPPQIGTLRELILPSVVLSQRCTALISKKQIKLLYRILHRIDLCKEGIIDTDVETWADAFQILMSKGYISEDNLIYLQHIIRLLNRADLLAATIEYATNHQQRVLYFYETTTDIRPDHRLVRIHVVGGRCQTGGDLDTIRMTISQILSVPPENIVFAGIEEANSLYVTLTLPAVYDETLEKFLENKTKHHILRPLFQLGIDRIEMSERSFEIEAGEETQRSDDKSDRIEIINKLQQDQIPRQRKYRVSNTKDQSNGKQSTRKRKQLSDLKEFGNKRSKLEKAGSFIHDLRVSPRRSKIVAH